MMTNLSPHQESFINGICHSNPDIILQTIARKIIDQQRIDFDEAVYLFENAELSFCGLLADYVRKNKHGDTVYFNRNFHIEPTNKCVFACNFCSYSRTLKDKDESWEMTQEEMLEVVRSYDGKPVTEVHIVGGVHPKLNLDFFCDLLTKIKEIRPAIHIKGYTAVELDYMIRKAKLTNTEGLKKLQLSGLDSLPGGGAEIFHPDIRSIICNDKVSSEGWLAIHEAAHRIGMQSNATMLYGHVEKYTHRVDHMDRLRQLQDKTGGFNTFIPLKFRNTGNEMSHIKECNVIDDLKTYAISRIYLDNFDHIKAYWPMIGRATAQLSLSFGVNDIDGTIDDTTKIYSMAGAEEQRPSMTTNELVNLIQSAGKKPIERDTLYNVINDFSKPGALSDTSELHSN